MAIAIAALVAAAPAGADGLQLAVPPAPLNVAFSEGVAPVSIVVRNTGEKKVALTVKYVGTGAGRAGLTAVKKATRGMLDLELVGGSSVNAQDATVIRLAFHRQGDKPVIDGAIVISADHSVLALPVSETQTPAVVGFEQSSASISARSWLGPIARSCRWLHFVFRGHCPDDAYTSDSTTVAARGVSEHDTLIGSDSGKSAIVAIAPRLGGGEPTSGRATRTSAVHGASALSASPTRAVITANHIPTPGTYAGAVAADPAVAEPKTIDVTVHARDVILWPLAALCLGLLVSYLLTTRRDRKRVANGLQVALQEAVEPYLKHRREEPSQSLRQRPDRYYLDHLLVWDRSGLAADPKQFPRRKWRSKRPDEPVAALSWDTDDIDDADKRATVTARIATEVSRFARWSQLNDAFESLEKAARPLAHRLPIFRDAESILDLAEGEPADDDEAHTRAATMTSFASVCMLYREVEKKFADAVKRYGRDWEVDHQSLNPHHIYEDEAPATSPEKLAALRLDLLRAQRLLARADRAPADDGAISARENRRANLMALDFDSEFTETFRAASGAAVVTRLLVPFDHRFQTAGEIRHSVREWDRVVFAVIALLTVLGYTLAFYSGKDWGTLADYATAFIAGATVPTVINWALLPSARPLTTDAKTSDSG